MKQWYTLHTKPHAEYRVATTLRQHEIEVFLPEITSLGVKRQLTEEPLFPCYLFMHVDLREISSFAWQWTPGLRRIVTFDGQPAPLSAEVINLIKCKLEDLNAQDSLTDNPFVPGDTVRITKDPFNGMLAIFEGPMTPSKRVRVLLTILGQQRRVRIDAANLEKVVGSVKGGRQKRHRRTRGRGRRIKT